MAKRIGILTSGGDCPGLNACIGSLVFSLEASGWTPIGIRSGITGLAALDSFELKSSDLSPLLLRSGGTFLGSSTGNHPFLEDNRSDFIEGSIKGYRQLNLDALIGIGGDGSLKILKRLSQIEKIPFIAIPKTIDNDISSTELSLGYATALDIATESISRLEPTARSHNRIMVLEVMGRDAGHIALGSGIAGYADVILIPERFYTFEEVCQKISSSFLKGSAIVVVAESVLKEDKTPCFYTHAYRQRRYGGIGHYIGDTIEHMLGIETRVTSLGHVQRGAAPNALDRILAASFGAYAVKMLNKSIFNHMVAWKGGNVTHVSLDKIKTRRVLPTDVLVETALQLGIYIGQDFPNAYKPVKNV